MKEIFFPKSELEKLVIIYTFEDLNKFLDLIEKVRIPKGSIGQSVNTMKLVFVNILTPNNLLQSIIENGSIPNQCKKLKIDHFLFSHNPLELIPPSVKELHVNHWSSNGGNRNILPSSIEILQINSICQFTNPIEIFEDSLPKSITRLVLKNIEGISNLEIPSSIRQLETSEIDIFQLLPNLIIPSTVDVLSIWNENHIKPGIIPIGIKELTIYQKKESFEKDIIPESVTKLILKKDNLFSIPKNEIKDKIFPRGLIHLETEFYIKFSKFGNDEFYLSNLNHLECRVKRITIGMFPSTLKKLILKVPKSLKEWEIPIGAFPESLELLSIEIPPNQIFQQGIFPNGLKTLKLDFRNNFNIPDIRDQPNIIPQSLNSLTISFYENPSQESIQRFFHLMNTLFSVSNSRLEIQIYKTRFISLEGPSDPFLYLQIQKYNTPIEEYFILKSNLLQALISLLKTIKLNL
eukprot:gene8085-9949_t